MQGGQFHALIAAAGLALMAGSAQAAAPAAPGNAAHGKQVFQEQCSLCHTTAPNQPPGAGPLLKGIVGRKAAGDPKFTYTAAMKKAKITWTADNITKLLTDPNKMVPNTAMPIALPSAKDRQDVVAYLATLK
jgi:cytochrome c